MVCSGSRSRKERSRAKDGSHGQAHHREVDEALAPETEMDDELHADLMPSIPEDGGPSPMAVDSQHEISREEGEMPDVAEDRKMRTADAAGGREGLEEGEL